MRVGLRRECDQVPFSTQDNTILHHFPHLPANPKFILALSVTFLLLANFTLPIVINIDASVLLQTLLHFHSGIMVHCQTKLLV